jgi:hypothetical protein
MSGSATSSVVHETPNNALMFKRRVTNTEVCCFYFPTMCHAYIVTRGHDATYLGGRNCEPR